VIEPRRFTVTLSYTVLREELVRQINSLQRTIGYTLEVETAIDTLSDVETQVGTDLSEEEGAIKIQTQLRQLAELA
jgi:hypothetical protein